jgi:hypothetical protein
VEKKQKEMKFFQFFKNTEAAELKQEASNREHIAMVCELNGNDPEAIALHFTLQVDRGHWTVEEMCEWLIKLPHDLHAPVRREIELQIADR